MSRSLDAKEEYQVSDDRQKQAQRAGEQSSEDSSYNLAPKQYRFSQVD